MTTTNTEQETATAPHREYHCPICGSIGKSLLGPYAGNTCSQLCACTAAIVEAIREAGRWHGPLDHGTQTVTPIVTTPPTW